jgi:hypothetical protein
VLVTARLHRRPSAELFSDPSFVFKLVQLGIETGPDRFSRSAAATNRQDRPARAVFE